MGFGLGQGLILPSWPWKDLLAVNKRHSSPTSSDVNPPPVMLKLAKRFDCIKRMVSFFWGGGGTCD